jgi:hypothetical protein
MASPAVLAGLGPASSTRAFDAWCGSKGMNCKVQFKDDRIVVDGRYSITYRQIKDIDFNMDYRYRVGGSYYLYTNYIHYEEAGYLRSARILFQNSQAHYDFWEMLRSARYVR